MKNKITNFLAVDIGNTETAVAIYKTIRKNKSHNCSSIIREKVIRIPTRHYETPDSLFSVFAPHFQKKKLNVIAISSVVPQLNSAWSEFGNRLLDSKTLLLEPMKIPGIELKIDNPSEAGIDRIVNAWMGFRRYGGPLIVVDMGTATTFDAIDKNGAYLGGIIAPGISLVTEALSTRTAKLPKIDLAMPKRVIGKNTVSALQSGIVLGHAKMIEGLLSEMQSELPGAKVVGTGGLMRVVQKRLNHLFDNFDEYLTLDGIAEIEKGLILTLCL